MQVQVKNVPQTLKDLGEFCCWKYEVKNGRKTKMPYNPLTGYGARTNDPSTFVPYATAVNASGYDGIESDMDKMVYWLEKAAEQGFVKAQFNCGNAYYKGKGTEINNERALYWYEKAAEQGEAPAQYNCGTKYMNGEGTAVDKEKALYWFKKAKENGDKTVEAYYESIQSLRVRNARKEIIDKGLESYRVGKYSDALYYLLKEAEQGNSYVQYMCGIMYYNGQGTRRDKKKALY